MRLVFLIHAGATGPVYRQHQACQALEVTNINFLIAHFATIYENIISLHVSLTFGTVCQTVLWMSVL